MAKYIELDVAKKAFQNMDAGRKHGSTLLTPEEFAEYLDELPAADVTPVRCGKWEETDWVEPDWQGFSMIRTPNGGFRCSRCANVFKRELLWKKTIAPTVERKWR